jgi:ORMDL family
MHDRVTLMGGRSSISTRNESDDSMQVVEPSAQSGSSTRNRASTAATATSRHCSSTLDNRPGSTLTQSVSTTKLLMTNKVIRPYTSWAYLRGVWTTNILLVICMKCLFSIIPGVSNEASWTMTNVIYNLVVIS